MNTAYVLIGIITGLFAIAGVVLKAVYMLGMMRQKFDDMVKEFNSLRKNVKDLEGKVDNAIRNPKRW